MPLLSEGCRRDLFFSASETRPDVPENPTFEFGLKSVFFSETPQYAAFPRLSGLSEKKGRINLILSQNLIFIPFECREFHLKCRELHDIFCPV
jgi:hypothetical protein